MSQIFNDCRTFKFSSHAVQRMFERSFTKKDVLTAIKNGEIITEYPEDKPYPSYLIFAMVRGRPLHVVCALDFEDKLCYIITAYEPDPKIWSEDFKTRR